ncbi:Basic-leucine zipper (bZIP) transcription factor [Neofusicoccum parvum]|uniref:Basic-leucine zipper (BZIP) transcription factor n=2 Tax=Neofusicoccum parvum TaxID=310453 RepID=A0ACB5S272_9PEZI|nr:putative regulatory protein cys-3 protein [Neofusicoccum parvum UCRNP2]GME26852.1 Basic-leucine zipper (bZIP) transcription factor [Neofusicoccum parvum]GME65374.1 Basic-leucine zipper (bZIP) transcription factor [Neofusicoccum parvum]
MSGFAGRRAPNVSQYIQDLNTVPTSQELQAQQQPAETFGGIDDDLSLFTNTEFFDFDLGTQIPQVSQAPSLDNFDPLAEERAQRRNAATASYGEAQPPQQGKNMDFNFTGEFQSLDFSFPVGGLSDSNFQHQPNPYPVQHQNGTSTSSPISATSPTASGGKRKFDGLNPSAQSLSIEDVSRLAAEEDKRRRNTAASARFRIKKKQREQQLEKNAKEMGDKVSTLESRVAQLEMENKWLKGLITEKNDGKNTSEFAELYRKFIGNDNSKEERSKEENKDGVGTKAEKA